MEDLKKHHIVKTLSFDSAQNGAKCSVYHLYPKEDLHHKVFRIYFLHGAVEHAQRHVPFFNYLRSYFGNRIIISCMDLVGHGNSSGSRAYIDDFDFYIQDYLNFLRSDLDFYHAKEKDIENILIAHSLGGMITLNMVSEYQIKLPFNISAIIMTNPCIKPKLKIPLLVKKIALSLNDYFKKVRIDNMYKGIDLTSDPVRALSFNEDHLISKFVTFSMGLEILKKSEKMINTSYYIRHPLFVLLSADDRVVSTEATKLYLGAVDKSLVKTSIYPQARHDLLNEKCRLDVFNEICEYIENRTWEKECID
ncbi:MAG: lysophospholipase [Bacteriovoracaceae bacterium]|nr:lysophospholipase [Bacteriovoracaceae bacterium]